MSESRTAQQRVQVIINKDEDTFEIVSHGHGGMFSLPADCAPELIKQLYYGGKFLSCWDYIDKTVMDL